MLKTDYDIPIFKDEDIADLNEYSNEMASALKTQLDKFGNPLVYKGKVATLEELPNEAESGNIYSVISENKNYIYNGTNWVEYSSTLDLTYLENNTKTTQTTEVSEALTIENCAPVSAKLDIKNGKTIQEEGEPSPDNIIPIRNVGDNINICDNSKVTSIDIRGDGTNRIGIDLGTLQNGTYYVSRKDKTKTEILYLTQVINGVYQDFETFGVEFAFTITEPCRCIIRSTNNQLNNWNTDIGELKIEKGSTPTPYTPYNCGSADFKVSNEDNSQSRIASFPFTAGQRLHIGDYLASDGIHQTRGTLILTGTEGWWSYETGVGGYGITFKHKGLDTNGLCSHYKLVKDYNTNNSFRISTNGFNFNVKSTFATIGDWKTYLAEQYTNGTPLTIEYELAEEIVTPYTTEQKEAYYELQHLLMYEGYTSIECIDEIKPDIQLTYWYNNELNKSYGERFDKVEDSINELENRNIYSTEEQVIGRWIYGKPIYRKVINFGALPNNTQKIVMHNIENIDFIVSCLGYAMNSSGSGIALPSNNGTINTNLYATRQQIGVVTTGDRSSFTTCYITLEYTKTTD